MNFRSLHEATDFSILLEFEKNQNFKIFCEKSEIYDFYRKSENLCKNHTFSPGAENSNKPNGLYRYFR